jgi:hypothetical protein
MVKFFIALRYPGRIVHQLIAAALQKFFDGSCGFAA